MLFRSSRFILPSSYNIMQADVVPITLDTEARSKIAFFDISVELESYVNLPKGLWLNGRTRKEPREPQNCRYQMALHRKDQQSASSKGKSKKRAARATISLLRDVWRSSHHHSPNFDPTNDSFAQVPNCYSLARMNLIFMWTSSIVRMIGQCNGLLPIY